jgi:phenylalanyl-tRNA synthetase beta chain
MINSLSADLDIMRPSLLPTGLEVIAHNINRKNANLSLFEFGKVYGKEADGSYTETKYLAIYASGDTSESAWNQKSKKADYYSLKATCEKVFAAAGIKNISYEATSNADFDLAAAVKIKNMEVGIMGSISEKRNKEFGIKQPVFVAHLNWDALINSITSKGLKYEEVSKFPSVQRDLALLVDKNVTYAQVEKTAASLNLPQLQSTRLFDIFESEKLGAGKKSMAVNFSFGDFNKTLTDVEIDEMMNKMIAACEKQLGAEIRK